MTSETNGADETTTYELDGNGNRTATIRPKLTRWEHDYDAADRLVAVRDPLLNETTYGYDGNNNLTRQTDAENRITDFTHDALNRRRTKTYPDSAVESATYDGNGNPLTSTDALGRTSTSIYDALNRQTSVSYPLPTPPTGDDLTSITTVYDENGNATDITEQYTGATGTRLTRQGFDTFDRLTSVTDPQGETVGYGYHPAGTRATLTDPDGNVTRYTYDAKQRLITVEVPNSGLTTYTYNADDDLTRITYPEGTEANTTYDTPGRATVIEHTRGATFISRFDYGYDPNGNRDSQHETRSDGLDETTTYVYDDADRLTEVAYPDATVTTNYDAVGNRLTETTVDTSATTTGDLVYAYNSRHQLNAITNLLDPAANVTYAYDANGNQIAKTVATETTAFTYDLRNQLTEITDSTGLLGRYRFDYSGLRIRKETATDTERYVYDQQSLLVETDDSGATLAKHNYGPRHLLSVEAASELDYYFVDVLGSPFQIANADGSVDTFTQYDAWGNVRSQVSGGAPDTFGFTGYQSDGESGLLYAKARFYDPEVGRFLNEDPFEGTTDTPPSLHRYLYGYSNPTVYFDPTGEEVVTPKEQTEREERLETLRQRLPEARARAEEIINGASSVDDEEFRRIMLEPMRLERRIERALENVKRGADFLTRARFVVESHDSNEARQIALKDLLDTEGNMSELEATRLLEEFLSPLPCRDFNCQLIRGAGENAKGVDLLQKFAGEVTIGVMTGALGQAFKIERTANRIKQGSSTLRETLDDTVRLGQRLPDGRVAGDGPGAALSQALGRASSNANGAPSRILLGEFMPRVRAAGRANGFRVWPARNWDEWVEAGVEAQKNRRWLSDQIRSGTEIFSLGKTPGFSRGQYYREEVSLLLKHKFRRRSAGTVEVPGFGEVPLYKWVRQSQ